MTASSSPDGAQTSSLSPPATLGAGLVHAIGAMRGRKPSTVALLLLSVAAGAVLLAGGAVAYWHFVYRPSRWFVDTPLYIVRTNLAGERTQKIQSTLLYGSDGTYAATNTVYEYGKPPSEQRYAGTWRQDKGWVCFRMAWQPDKEFCNSFVETAQGWILLNRASAQTTPISLAPLSALSDKDLVPPTPPPAGCSFAGRTVAHAASVPAFQTSIVGSGQSCQAEVRTCTNGQLSGSFENASCSAAIALPATPTARPAARPRPRP